MGILIGLALDDVPALVSVIVQGLAGGTFIYIGALEIPQQEFGDDSQSECADRRDPKKWGLTQQQWTFIKFFAMALGVVVIAGVAFVPHDHDHGGDGHDH